MNSSLLAPSLLAGNHARLAESLQYVEDANLEWIHLDIMDGHFLCPTLLALKRLRIYGKILSFF